MTGSLPIRLNNKHRPEDYCSIFKLHGRLHVPNILEANDATGVYGSVNNAASWTRSIHLEEGRDIDISVKELDEMSSEERANLEMQLANGSTDSLQYIFDTIRISKSIDVGHSLPPSMSELNAFLNGPGFLDFVRRLTGDDRPAFADVMATRYLPGHFLTAHGDENPAERRLYAYVLNLTPKWRADWGGVLMFLDDDGHVAEGYVPSFNALNIFSVPQTHAVSMVTRFAQFPRLSVTGWIHDRP